MTIIFNQLERTFYYLSFARILFEKIIHHFIYNDNNYETFVENFRKQIV